MPLALDPRRTALVMIDLQKGIVSRPLDPHPAAQVVQNSVALARRLAELGGLVVPVHVAFSPDGGDRLAQPVDTAMQAPTGAMSRDFFEFAPEIVALNAPIAITKRHWGAFDGTELDLQLRRRKIESIILTGIATNFGVESTAREAWQLGYSLIIPEDACTSVAPGMHQFAFEKIFPRLARIRSTPEILEALKSQPSAS